MSDQVESSYDAIVVGARCAGAWAAGRLAGAGWEVLLLDHRPPPRNVVSTHYLFPNTISRLAEAGVIERIERHHKLNYLGHRFVVLDNEMAGTFTPVGGFDRGIAPRRPVLDAALLAAAVDAGAQTAFGPKVVGLIGAGTSTDPVTGVVLDSGERIAARWVIGADGRASSVAAALGLERERPLQGEVSAMFGYWRGLPPVEETVIGDDGRSNFSWFQCEDDITQLWIGFDPGDEAGSAQERERKYRQGILDSKHLPGRDLLERAEQVGRVQIVPETLMRGFFRRPAGAGWVLVGDACHFKHPASAQGISDAIEQAIYVADALAGAGGDLSGYQAWRDERAAEHYEFSFQLGSRPRPEVSDPVFGGIASDRDATQDFLDLFTRRTRPRTDVFTAERLDGWFGAPAAS